MTGNISSPPQSLRDSSPLKGERERLSKLAKKLRQNATEEERRLWHYIRKLKGYRFRRQVRIGIFIVDFCCHQTKTIIELDGSQHAEDSHMIKDKKRDHWLKKEGFTVFRFWNPVSDEEWDGVIDTLVTHSRSPLRGELAAKPSEGVT